MTCDEARPLLDAYLDGELDAGSSLAMEKHLKSCVGCAGEFNKLERLRDEIASAGLDFADEAVLKRLRARVRPTRWWKGAALTAAATAVVVLAVFLPGRGSADRELVDNHLRSLMAGRLVDVESSDRHTVKPWFQGRLEFVPSVPDLTTEGFALIGGRVDVLNGRKVAAIVYKRREHVINVWIAPGSGPAKMEAKDVEGYHLLRWSKDGMTYEAVSDLAAVELRTFAEFVKPR